MVLRDLEKIAETLKKFLVFLGPNLKAVTGNSEGIDKLVEEVKNLVKPFESAEQNFFQKPSANQWQLQYTKFKNDRQAIETNTVKLIHDTFKDLRSAEGAFDLLQKFKNVGTVDAIAQNLQSKYSDVLKRYSQEVEKNRELFEKGRDSIDKNLSRGEGAMEVINKGKPPYAGAIAWSRTIF
jgi:dynein heavy chain